MTLPNLNRIFSRTYVRYSPPETPEEVPETPVDPETPVVMPGPADIEFTYTERADDTTPGDSPGHYYIVADGSEIVLSASVVDGELLPPPNVGDQMRLRWPDVPYAIDVLITNRVLTSDQLFNPPLATSSYIFVIEPSLDMTLVPLVGVADLRVGPLGVPPLPDPTIVEQRYDTRVAEIRSNQSDPGEWAARNFQVELSRMDADFNLLRPIADFDTVRFRFPGAYSLTVVVTLAQSIGVDGLRLYFPDEIRLDLLPPIGTSGEMFIGVVPAPTTPEDPDAPDTGSFEVTTDKFWGEITEEGIAGGILNIAGTGPTESVQITATILTRFVGRYFNVGDSIQDDLERIWTVIDSRLINERRYIEIRAAAGIYIS